MKYSRQGITGKLLKRAEEFQAKEAHFSSGFLAQDLSYDWWGFARNQTGGGGRRGGDGQMNCLVWPENMRGGNTSPNGADIEGLGEFDELDARDIGSPKEHRHLQANAWRASG